MESENLKMQAFLSFCVCVVCAHPNDRVCSQAFLLETMETRDKNHHDFHCLEVSLVICMRFIFGDD